MSRQVLAPSLLAAIALAAGACADQVTPPAVRNLDRPTAVAFGCYGDMRVTNGAAADPSQDVIVSAQPTEACAARSRPCFVSSELEDCGPDATCVDADTTDMDPGGCVPKGQEDGPVSPNFAGFVLQSSKGTVAVVQWGSGAGIVSGAVQDSDPLAPGKNALAIGTLPVDIVTAPNGCHVITANAGSCDLSVMDINSALDPARPAQISRIGVQATTGPVLAKPKALVAQPPGTDIGYECQDQVQGTVWISYPRCNLAAAVDSATGDVLGGVQFGANGTVTITDGDVSCPDECGDGAIVTAESSGAFGLGTDPDRPGDLVMSKDGSRLFIAAENNPAVTVVNLDADFLPVSTNRMTVEGQVGFGKIAVSDVIHMGGALGEFGVGSAGDMQFVYAIASDRTVRVLEVKMLNTECDTQVDPREIHDVTDVTLLSCIPVSAGYRRRPGAVSPGIPTPYGQVPLDIAFTKVDNGGDKVEGSPSPTTMVGHFAFLTTSGGYVFIINVDDDHAPDFEDPEDPTATSIPLAIAHQIRDFGFSRDAVASVSDSDAPGATTPCSYPAAEVNLRGPRLGTAPSVGFDEDAINFDQHRQLVPELQQQTCTYEVKKPDDSIQTVSTPVPNLSFMADVNTREQAFPDLKGVKNESWRVVWEGPLSEDDANTNIDGPQLRLGVVDVDNGVTIRDATSPYCAMGVEPYDILTLLGCDPANGDAECGIGQTCYSHPDRPSDISGVSRAGMCLPTADVDRLSGVCRDLLISRKRYSIVDTYKDHVTLAERRRVLSTTPIDGCTDNNECVQYAQLKAALGGDETDEMGNVLGPLQPFEFGSAKNYPTNWACTADPSRAPGPNTCQMTCSSSADCESGWHCASDGFCVEAPLPPAECVPVLERYLVSVGGAFRVLGSVSGFLHHRIADPGTGECIDDPNGNPLLIGRLPLTAPPCTGDGMNDLTPNPCSTTVDHTEEIVGYQFIPADPNDDASKPRCKAPGDEYDAQENLIKSVLRVRQAPAIRFRNPAMTFNMVDMVTQGDKECFGDGLGTRRRFSAVMPGYQLAFTTTGGDDPMFVGKLDTNGARTPVRTAFPDTIEPVPDGTLWVLDQGDVLIAQDPTRGRIVSVNPAGAETTFDFDVLR